MLFPKPPGEKTVPENLRSDEDYFRLAETAVHSLAAPYPSFAGDTLEFDSRDDPQPAVEGAQLTMALAESPGGYQGRRSSTPVNG